jgi:hypothetical protein
MKQITIILAIMAFTSGFAQENEMKKSETTITKTTVVNNTGADISTKAVTDTEEQSIAIQGQVDRSNFNTTLTPLTSNSEVSYSHNDINYTFESEDNGYKLMSLVNNKPNEYAIIRPSAREGYYICSQNGDNSMSYFDQNGNFVVESYDIENDAVISTIYKLQSTTMTKKN